MLYNPHRNGGPTGLSKSTRFDDNNSSTVQEGLFNDYRTRKDPNKTNPQFIENGLDEKERFTIFLSTQSGGSSRNGSMKMVQMT
jgi:hypothetical protein